MCTNKEFGMAYPENTPETRMSEVIAERDNLGLSELSPRQLSGKFNEIFFMGMTNIRDAAYALEAKDRLDRFDRLQRLLGLLAPAGTAPRTALEQLYIQSENSADESPIVLDLRHMLSQHWGEWTPALREAEGLPPADEK